MSFGLRILAEADGDVDDLAAYIAKDSIEQSMRFYDAVNATYKLILEAPNRWPLYGLKHPRLSDVRRRSVRGFPNHLIFYRVDADIVEIVRVVHGARDLPAIFQAMEPDE